MIVPVPMPFTWRGASLALPPSSVAATVFCPWMLTTAARASRTARTTGVMRSGEISWAEIAGGVGRGRVRARLAARRAAARGRHRWARGVWVIGDWVERVRRGTRRMAQAGSGHHDDMQARSAHRYHWLKPYNSSTVQLAQLDGAV